MKLNTTSQTVITEVSDYFVKRNCFRNGQCRFELHRYNLKVYYIFGKIYNQTPAVDEWFLSNNRFLTFCFHYNSSGLNLIIQNEWNRLSRKDC